MANRVIPLQFCGWCWLLNKIRVILASFLWVVSTSAFANDAIKFAVTQSDTAAFNACHLNTTDIYPKCSTCLAGIPTTSAFVNYAVFAHALRSGRMDIPLTTVEFPNSERSRRSIAAGAATTKGDWDFNIDGNADVYKSVAFIKGGTIVKGLYGLSSNITLRRLQFTSDLQNLSAAMNPKWRLDWKILNALGLRELVSTSTKNQMFTLVARRGIDFTLFEFSDFPDLAHIQNEIRLVPAPGVKLSLPNSQHFMISKKHPKAKQILEAVNRGLTNLHADGFIRTCLAESGIVNARVEDWTVLNPSAEPLSSSEASQ